MPTVTIFANCLYYPQGGGHFWVYLNWALGLRDNGCRVIWMESISGQRPLEGVRELANDLQARLSRFGFNHMGLTHWHGQKIPPHITQGFLTLADAVEPSDLLLNFSYGTYASNVLPFRRKAMVDIDPGLTQVWMSRGEVAVAQHDTYFTIGETVGLEGSRFSDVGLPWIYTPPCVYLPEWPVTPAAPGASLTTVTHWSAKEWVVHGQESYSNSKRDGFLPFVDLPKRTAQPLELAVCLSPIEDDQRSLLLNHGWHLRDANEVAGTPQAYRDYLQFSRGEFSCVKPSCVRLQNAWISDRSLCYLASGKPVIMENTGPSRMIPDGRGVWRFRTPDEAAQCIAQVNADYPRQCQLARQLAEEKFDAVKVADEVLGRAL